MVVLRITLRRCAQKRSVMCTLVKGTGVMSPAVAAPAVSTVITAVAKAKRILLIFISYATVAGFMD